MATARATIRSWRTTSMSSVPVRLTGLIGGVALLHLAGWGIMLLLVAPHYPVMLGLGGLAYAFGLRHAFDADHIAAIDNTTRKLLQEGQKPLGVGFFFSLGHSTVVFLIALALGIATQFVVRNVVNANGQLKNLGGLLGTGVSGVFLLLIGILNLIILLDIVRLFRRMRAGEYDRHSLEHELVAGGLLTRLFGRLFKMITHSWQMYLVGFLFGLGFDTASEISFLAISAGAAAQHIPLYALISLPLIFAAGMSLMDTADGAFMSHAYSWAFSNPVRKVFYNLTVTALSVFVALFVGGVELTQLLIQQLNLRGGIWDSVGRLSFGSMGYVIVGAFVVTWAGAFLIYKSQHIEERWSRALKN
ncbi:MAG TPA: HoxN/HupN/NixA family nickel/cobalt transporter [Candidatus Dormibacteraeota bacterium]|nr:HoxN/HupN/NixA family nickel/cobalt transporter [Candidatus Dormibacteraeota bacterium]